MTFQIYNKKIGFWVNESNVPTQDPELGNTEVPLPGAVGQGYTYAFDESIQMWRYYTAEQWENYLAKKMTRLPDNDEQFKAMVTEQLLSLSKSVLSASTQLALTTRSVTELQTQLKELQTQLKQLTEAKQLTAAKEEAQHV